MNPNEPDMSFGDYYCSVCDSHINSQLTWTSHIAGRRHIKNSEKHIPESKYQDLDLDSRKNLKKALKHAEGPIVGLFSICEHVRRPTSHFTCFLCSASLPTPVSVVEHVTSLDHKLRYIKHVEPEQHKSIIDTHLSKEYLTPLVDEKCCELESRLGRGHFMVKKEKRWGTPDRRIKSETPERRIKSEKKRNIIPLQYKQVIKNQIQDHRHGKERSLSSEGRRTPDDRHRMRHEKRRRRRTPESYRSRSRSRTPRSRSRCQTPVVRDKCRKCRAKKRRSDRSEAAVKRRKCSKTKCGATVVQPTPTSRRLFSRSFLDKIKKMPAKVFIDLMMKKMDTFQDDADLEELDMVLLRKLENACQRICQEKMAGIPQPKPKNLVGNVPLELLHIKSEVSSYLCFLREK